MSASAAPFDVAAEKQSEKRVSEFKGNGRESSPAAEESLKAVRMS